MKYWDFTIGGWTLGVRKLSLSHLLFEYGISLQRLDDMRSDLKLSDFSSALAE